jgi:hypothetical protein
VQILLALTALLVCILGFRWMACIWGAFLLWGGLLASTIPFVRRAKQANAALAPWAIFFIIVRSYAFVVGVIAGMFGLLLIKPGNRPLAQRSSS